MATAQTIINRALRLLAQTNSGEAPTAQETADALIALNALLDAWRNEALMTYALRTETLALVPTQADYLIGPAGSPTPDLVTDRPTALVEAYAVIDDLSRPVRIVSEAEYALIGDKETQAEWPDSILFRPTMPAATVICYPVPNAAASLKLVTRVPLTAFAAASDAVTLPPGWEEALALNLAVSIGPEYETEAKASTAQRAVATKAAIKRANQRPAYLRTEIPALIHGVASDITNGP